MIHFINENLDKTVSETSYDKCRKLTRQIPRIELVQIDLSDDLEIEVVARHFPTQILNEKFFVGREKTEAGGQAQLRKRVNRRNNHFRAPILSACREKNSIENLKTLSIIFISFFYLFIFSVTKVRGGTYIDAKKGIPEAMSTDVLFGCFGVVGPNTI